MKFNMVYGFFNYLILLEKLSLIINKKLASGFYKIGCRYFNGIALNKDYIEAFHWFKLSAELGNLDAKYKVGVMYLLGIGVERNYSMAVPWLNDNSTETFLSGRKGVGDNIYTTMWNDGVFEDGDFVDGRHVFRGRGHDAAEGLYWTRLAASEGEAGAQHALGSFYEFGIDVKRNPAEAIRWYKLADAQDYPAASHSLGIIYMNGIFIKGICHVEVNIEESFRFLKKAADRGFQYAFTDLGKFYEEGVRVPQDYVSAHMWYNLTPNLDFKNISRDSIAMKMTNEQIAEAQNLAKAYQDKRV